MSGNNSFNQEAKNLNITVVDSAKYGLNAEASAMLSALCSRSNDGPRANLALVQEKGAEAFMETYYLGYGHGSIGKCGSSKVFITGVSMIAINHLQNMNPLYAGQESSTRYIPFSSENVVVPESIKSNPEALAVYLKTTDALMAAYEGVQEDVFNYLMENLEKPEDVSDKKWEATVRPRTFDICRSLLPSGLKTVGVWDGNLENFRQQIGILANHKNLETRAVAMEILEKLIEEYPSSFTSNDAAPDAWLAKHSQYVDRTGLSTDQELRGSTDMLILPMLDAYTREVQLWDRPKYGRLPHDLGHFGQVHFQYSLDFGGYRDVNRHRKGNISRSLMYPGSLNMWYRHQFADAGVYAEVNGVLNEVSTASKELLAMGIPMEDVEYMLPMGSTVDVQSSYPLDNAVYVAELRSGATVHPTVRRVAAQMGEYLRTFCNFPIYAQTMAEVEIDTLDPRRADQTITKK